MKDKVVLVTGATNGIGREAARALAAMGATVIITGRDSARTAATAADIIAQTGNPRVETAVADLSEQAQVRALAREIKARHTRLDVLLNNAGAIFMQREVSADGIEMSWALNHLGYFVLTGALLDLLKSSAPARIINVSSAAHTATGINFQDVQYANTYRGFTAYGQSKLANIMFTYALARRLDGSGVTVNALHPGGVATNFGMNSRGLARLGMRIFRAMAMSPARGAQTPVHLASSPAVEGTSGRYWRNSAVAVSSPASMVAADQERLWTLSEKMTAA